MLDKEEKVVAAPEESEIEIEDVDIGLTEQDVEKVKEEVDKKVRESHVLNKEQQELFSQIMEEAKMPVKLTDGKFQMGENELDIRYLSKANKEQMMFRTGVLNNVYLKQVLTSLIDITRLLMVLADHLGIEEIVKATDDIIEKIEKQEKIKAKLKREAKVEAIKAEAENNKA